MLPEPWTGYQYEPRSEETKVNYTALLDEVMRESSFLQLLWSVGRLDGLYILWCILAFDEVSTGHCYFQR